MSIDEELRASLTAIAKSAIEWGDRNLNAYVVPKEKRINPGDVFGKPGEVNYERAKNQLQRVIDNGLLGESDRVNKATTDGTPSSAGADNIKEGLGYLAKSAGLDAGAILEQYRAVKNREALEADNVENPVGWDAFNDMSAKLRPVGLPSRIKDLFIRIINSKVTTEKKSHDTGDLDPSKFPTYYTGDVWVREEEAKPKVAIYIYSDNSGSMNMEMSGETTIKPGEDIQSRNDVMKEILTTMFQVLIEAQESGKALRWAYAVFGREYVQRKRIDETISKSKIPGLFVRPNGDENIWEVVKDWKKIESEPNERVIIIVLSDGEFVQTHTTDMQTGKSVVYEPYELISKNNKTYNHIWIPIDYDPATGHYGSGDIGRRRKETAIKLYGGLKTTTKGQLYDVLARQLKKALDKLM